MPVSKRFSCTLRALKIWKQCICKDAECEYMGRVLNSYHNEMERFVAVMRKRFLAMVLLSFVNIPILVGVLLLNGCGEKVSTEEFQVESTENTESANRETTKRKANDVMGEFCHGVNWSDASKEHVLYYEGGEMKIPYRMKGNGIGASAGFLLFLDGIFISPPS